MSGFSDSEPIPVVGVSPNAGDTNGYRFNRAWGEILIGLLEFALWSDFWAGSQSEIDTAVTHTQELMGILSGELMRNVVIARHRENNNVAGGGSIAAGWQQRKLNMTVGWGGFYNLGSDKLTLDPGDYWAIGYCFGYKVGYQVARLTCSDAPKTYHGPVSWTNNVAGGEDVAYAFVEHLFTLSSQETLQLDHYTQYAVATNGLGGPANIGVDEIYAILRVVKLG